MHLLVHVIKLEVHLEVLDPVWLLQNLLERKSSQTDIKRAHHKAPCESRTIHHRDFGVCALRLLSLVSCQFLDQLLVLIVELNIHG